MDPFIEGQMWQILSYQHVKMQQRAPIVRTKMVNLKTGAVNEQAFRSGDKFEDVFLERKEIQYLYHDGSLYHFMNTADYSDVVMNEKVIGGIATLAIFCSKTNNNYAPEV